MPSDNHLTTTIQPWGNSLGLRITRLVAKLGGLEKGSLVIIEPVEGGLLVKPVHAKRIRSRFTEADLVRGLDPFRAHADELPAPLPTELDA